MELPNIAVLMSTYNGEKYVQEQIDTILSQKNVNITLYIRDDGSSDGTVKIIQKIAIFHSNVHLFQGDSLGVGISFMKLLFDHEQHDYFAFADQDDIWYEDKLITAITLINSIVKKIISQFYIAVTRI